MENGKVWAPIIVLGMLVAAFFCYSYFEKVDKANEQFQNAKLITTQAQDSLAGRQQMLLFRTNLATQQQKALKRVQHAEQRVKSAEDMIANADKKQRAIEGDVKYWINSLPLVIQASRDSLAGTDIPELVLKNGKTIKNARIKKIDEASVSIVHSDGIATVAASDLPDAMQVKFDCGDNALLRRFSRLQDSLGAKPAVASSHSVTSPAAASETNASKAAAALAQESKLKAMKLKKADLDVKLAAAAFNERKWLAHMQSLSEQISTNQARGVPTSRQKEEYQKANAQLSAVQAGIFALAADIKKVQVEIETLTNSLNSR